MTMQARYKARPDCEPEKPRPRTQALMHILAASALVWRSSHGFEATLSPEPILNKDSAAAGGPDAFPPLPVPPVGDDWPGWAATQRDDRYNLWLSHVQFHMIPSFTEVGFEKRQIPPSVLSRLQEYVIAACQPASLECCKVLTARDPMR